MNNRTCTTPECERPAIAKAMCTMHYQRMKKHGDPTFSEWNRTANERFWSKVNKTDACWHWTGAASGIDGYGRARRNGGTRLVHRVAYEMLVGPIPDGMHIDHICHNRKCVRPEHLRPVTQKQNMENHRGATVRSKTGVRGVFPVKRRPGWYDATVGHEGKSVHLGEFASLDEAEAAVIAKRIELFTHNNVDRRINKLINTALSQ